MAYWFDQKIKLPKFRLLNSRVGVGFTVRIGEKLSNVCRIKSNENRNLS